jgi:hypothetical protein
MGEYLPPPYGLLQLADYLEAKMAETDIEILDCQAMSLDWKGLEKRIAYAKYNSWIKNCNWADYDLIHPVMPTESLSREKLQYELYNCYRSFFGSWSKRMQGFFSKNRIKRRVYRYMARQSVLSDWKAWFERIVL